MLNNTKTIKCGRCKVPLKGPAKPKDDDMFSCPRCGTSEKFERVLAEVKEFVSDQAANQLAAGLRGATRGNQFVKFTTKLGPKRSYRFVVDL